MKVLNRKTNYIPKDAVYVGRPSKWGNPYQIGSIFAGKVLTGEDCIVLYGHYLQTNKELLKNLEELRGKDLVCWCSPLPCHADILLDLANGHPGGERRMMDREKISVLHLLRIVKILCFI